MILALAAATATIATTVEALAAGVTTAVAIYGIAKTGKKPKQLEERTGFHLFFFYLKFTDNGTQPHFPRISAGKRCPWVNGQNGNQKEIQKRDYQQYLIYHNK